MYYIVAYRESGEVSKCPIPFPDLESARFCAVIALHHFGPDFTILIEGDNDGAEPELRPADYHTAGDAAPNSAAGRYAERDQRVGRDPEVCTKAGRRHAIAAKHRRQEQQ